MAQNDQVKVLKFALLIGAIVNLVYGAGYFIVPDAVVSMSGGNPVDAGWLRWAGGVLIAWGIGALMVYGKPEKQHIFVTYYSLAYLLVTVGLFYSLFMHEYSCVTWFIAFPAILTLVIAILLYWGRSQAKDVL